ncbi:hypothetical protein BC940DRAFT_290968 [Gongronella butleri]|nr:hypothetical protein BC940DRAFT_290968 [Gongronella butleri]
MSPSVKRTKLFDASDSEAEEDIQDTQQPRKRVRLEEDAVNGQDREETSTGSQDSSDDDYANYDMTKFDFRTEKNSGTTLAGTVARVELFNFMCHKYLVMDFGPKINFVIGHNGSGKSAVLTAMMIALGAKATATNRGKKLSSLIREGANAASVSVYLTNAGSDAYKHEIFGDTIIIERRLVKDGSGSLKIQTNNKKTVSTKREDLVEITDHLCIQVDNPFTMLSQDMARQFLSNSTPSEKYNLYMRGTLLQQLDDDLKKVDETLEITKSAIERKKQVLPELHRRAFEASARFDQLRESSNYETEMDALNNELVWSQVVAKEKDLEAKEAEVQKCEERVAEMEDKIKLIDVKINKFKEEIAELKERKRQYQETNEPNNADRIQLNEELVKAQSDLDKLRADAQKTSQQFRTCKEDLRAQTQKVEDAKRRLESNNQEKLDRINGKMQSLRSRNATLEQEVDGLKQRQRNENAALVSAKEEQKQLQNAVQDAKRTVDQNHNALRSVQASKEDSIRAFGDSMPALIRDINAHRWRGPKPVGPFGRYMSLKYPQYGEVLEVILGKMLSDFAVENFDDQAALRGLLSRHRVRSNIIVANRDIFDIPPQPNEEYLTILRAMDISDEYVKRQLIIAKNIHQILLMDDRANAEEIMASRPVNVKACYTKECQNVGARYGYRTESLRRHTGPVRFNKDIESEIRRLTHERRECEQVLREARDAVTEHDNKIRRHQTNLANIAREIQRREQEMFSISRQIRQCETDLRDEEPDDLQLLEEERQESADQAERTSRVFQALKEQGEAANNKVQDVKQELRNWQLLYEEFQAGLAAHDSDIRNLEDLARKTERKKNDAITDRDTEMTRVERHKQAYNHLDRTVKDWTAQATEDYPHRVEPSGTTSELQRRIKHLQDKIDAATREAGMTLEEAEKIAFVTSKEYEDLKGNIGEMNRFIKKMKYVVHKRRERWYQFRMYLALGMKLDFHCYLHKRGDEGTIKIKHDKGTLELCVNTSGNPNGKFRKDSRSLSGGEKSFAQISFLLALWDRISTPILCLDEFDVYMDAVNRKTSMQMMMESAYETNSQYILITPQDASSMVPGENVTIHRLDDPERAASQAV